MELYTTQIGDTYIDAILVESLMKHYPEHDGYICLNLWPSYHHGGFLGAETCIFRPDESVDLTGIVSAGGSSRKTRKVGGTQSVYGNNFNFEDYLKRNNLNYYDVVKVNPLIGK